MKTPLLLLGLALACALWAPAAEASTIIRAPNNLSIARGLVGWWNFDGKSVAGTLVFDASGTGNYGTMTNGPVLTEGKLGQGMQFDGSNDYVDVGNDSSIDIGGKNVTIALWVKSSYTEGTQWLMEKGIVQSFDIAWNTSAVNFRAYGVGTTDHSYSINLLDGSWKFFAWTIDGTNLKFYLNGTNVQSWAMGYPSSISSSPLFIGCDQNNNACLNGLIDDVRIYNRALTSDEIKRLYNLGR